MADRINPKLKSAYDFFYKNSGRVGAGRKESAIDLARAEAIAEELGWECRWEDDQEEYQLGDEEEMPNEVLTCVLYDEDDEVLSSLGGVGDPSKTYGRIVEAELASEALWEKGLL